ncbi:hypothetical protein PIB30_007096 [Stylosanthes scabra]|uniref:Uncharacterized protein n=1 Tax=Stylosanthes scabra TaxID=79078 RepID=A0ABU6S4D3_9FABA|nr:hypothetical protein [Stylosanthes scabra]
MGFLELFSVASIPVIKVLLVTAIGLFLAVDQISILGEDARKKVNHLVFYVFNLSLVGCSLAETITLESFLLVWFMPINILVTFILGSGLGWIVIKITRPPKHMRCLTERKTVAERKLGDGGSVAAMESLIFDGDDPYFYCLIVLFLSLTHLSLRWRLMGSSSLEVEVTRLDDGDRKLPVSLVFFPLQTRLSLFLNSDGSAGGRKGFGFGKVEIKRIK